MHAHNHIHTLTRGAPGQPSAMSEGAATGGLLSRPATGELSLVVLLTIIIIIIIVISIFIISIIIMCFLFIAEGLLKQACDKGGKGEGGRWGEGEGRGGGGEGTAHHCYYYYYNYYCYYFQTGYSPGLPWWPAFPRSRQRSCRSRRAP